MYSTRRASDKKLVASVEKGCHGERHLCCVAILLFCHYERSINCHREHSAAICYQADCVHHATNVARGRLTFRLRGKILLGVRNDEIRIVIANAVWRSVIKEIASVSTFHRNDKGLAASSGVSWREALRLAAIC